MEKTYLITRASKGIGLEVARQAAAEGGAVLMITREAAKLLGAAATLPDSVTPETFALDLSIQRFSQYIDTLGVAEARS